MSRSEQVVPLRQLDHASLPVLSPLFAIQLGLVYDERRERVHLLLGQAAALYVTFDRLKHLLLVERSALVLVQQMEHVTRDDGLDRKPGSLALEARRLVALLLVHLTPVSQRVEGDHLRRDDRDVEQHQTLDHGVDHEHQIHRRYYSRRLDDELDAVTVPVNEPALLRGGQRVLGIVTHGRPHVLLAELEDANRLTRLAILLFFKTGSLVVIVVLQLGGDLHALEPQRGIFGIDLRVVHLVQVRAEEFQYLMHRNCERLPWLKLVKVLQTALHANYRPRQEPLAVHGHVLVLHVERHVLRRRDEHVPRVAAVAPPQRVRYLPVLRAQFLVDPSLHEHAAIALAVKVGIHGDVGHRVLLDEGGEEHLRLALGRDLLLLPQRARYVPVVVVGVVVVTVLFVVAVPVRLVLLLRARVLLVERLPRLPVVSDAEAPLVLAGGPYGHQPERDGVHQEELRRE